MLKLILGRWLSAAQIAFSVICLASSAFASVEAVDGPLLVCGNVGSVRERIDHCYGVNKDAANRLRWKLVMVDPTLKEFWVDTRTRLIWGPRLGVTQTYFQALMNCANVGIPFLNRVASVDEFEVATFHEMQSVLPDLKDPEPHPGSRPQDFYWTSTTNKTEVQPTSAYAYWASASVPGDGEFQPMLFETPQYVRCVGLANY
jgi:hypothetical protein